MQSRPCLAMTMLWCSLAMNAFAAPVDEKTGLAVAPGFELVSVHCTVCHSARLVTQNRSDRKGWEAMIRWMQETQGLWPLGESEALILDYLADNYGPLQVGRRKPLTGDLLPPVD